MSNASLMSWHDGGYNTKAASNLSHLRRKTVISQNSVIGKWLQSNDDDELSRRRVAQQSSASSSSSVSLSQRAKKRLSITAHLDVGRRMEPFCQSKGDVTESDYNNRNELYKAIEEKRFTDAINITNKNPDLAHIWIVRKNSDKEVVLRRLPLHLACIFRSPHELIRSLLNAYEKAAQLKDQWLNLPIHYMCEKGCDTGETMQILLRAYPDCLNMKGMRNMVPLSMVRKGSPPDKDLMLQQFHNFLLHDFSSQLEKDIANAHSSQRNGFNMSNRSLSTQQPSTRSIRSISRDNSMRTAIGTREKQYQSSTRSISRGNSMSTVVETRVNQDTSTNISHGPSGRFISDEENKIQEIETVPPEPYDEDPIDPNPNNDSELNKTSREPSVRLTPYDNEDPNTISHGPSVRFTPDEPPIHPNSSNDNVHPETVSREPSLRQMRSENPLPSVSSELDYDDDHSDIPLSNSEKVNRCLEDKLTDLEAQLENALSENAVMKDVIKMLMEKIKRADRIINDKNNNITDKNNVTSLTKTKSLRDSFSRSDLSGRLGQIIIDNRIDDAGGKQQNLRDSFRRMEGGGKHGLNVSHDDDFDDLSSVNTNPVSVSTDVQYYGGMRGSLNSNKHYCDAAQSSRTASIY